MREERGREALGRGAVRYQNGPRQAECQVRYGGDGMRRDGRGLDGGSDDLGGGRCGVSVIGVGQNGAAKFAIRRAAAVPARTDLHNDPCTKRPQYHYTRYTPSSAAGLSLILRMDRSTSAMIRLLTRGDQLVDPLSGVQRRPVRHPAQSVGQLDQRIRRPGRLREYHPRWARGTGCTHSRRQRSGVPPGSRHPSRSS